MKTRARGFFEYNTYNNRNDDDYQDNTHEYEEEEKEDRRREKGDSDEDEEHTGKDLAMALMAVMEVRTMIMNAKTVGKIKRKIIQRCR